MWVRILSVLAVAFAFSLPCFAEESRIDSSFLEMMEGIPQDVAALLPESFFGGIDQASEGLDQVLDMGFWGELFGDLFSTGFAQVAPTLLAIFAVLIVSAIISLFRDAFHSEALSTAVGIASSAVLISLVIRTAVMHVEAVNVYLSRLGNLCAAMIPVMGAVLAAGGSGGAAVATHGGFMMVLGIIEAVVGQAFGGIVGIGLALSVANVFSGKFRLSAVSRAVRKCFGLFFGIVTALLGFVISIKIGIAAAGDSVAMRGAKIFASNAIPVVGAAVGDSLRTLATALSFVKSVSGAVGIVLILLLALPVFLTVWLFRAGLILLSGAAEMLGCDKERELISGVVSVYGYILAAVALTAVVFVLLLTLFIKTALAFGGGI